MTSKNKKLLIISLLFLTLFATSIVKAETPPPEAPAPEAGMTIDLKNTGIPIKNPEGGTPNPTEPSQEEIVQNTLKDFYKYLNDAKCRHEDLLTGYTCTTRCEYKHGIIPSGYGVKFKMYDAKGKVLFNNDKLLAGTRIYTSLYEQRNVTWYGVGYKVKTCHRPEISHIGCPGGTVTTYPDDEDGNIDKNNSYTYCPEDHKGKVIDQEEDTYECILGTDEGCTIEAQKMGYADAKKYLKSIPSSYELKLNDPNDAECHTKKKKEPNNCK